MARGKVTEAGSGVGIDTTDLRAVALAMRKASTVARRNFKAGMYEGAEIVVLAAKARVYKGSSRIKDTIAPHVRGALVEITGGQEDDPLARLFETGNLRKGRVQETADPARMFRHPLWGSWGPFSTNPDPRNQKTHPFLYPAALFSQRAVAERLMLVFAEALRAEGIKVE